MVSSSHKSSPTIVFILALLSNIKTACLFQIWWAIQKASGNLLCFSKPPVLSASSTMQHSSINPFLQHQSVSVADTAWRGIVSGFLSASSSRRQCLGDRAGCDAGSSGRPALAFSPLSSSSSSSSTILSSPTCVLPFSPVCIVLSVSFTLPLWKKRMYKEKKLGLYYILLYFLYKRHLSQQNVAHRNTPAWLKTSWGVVLCIRTFNTGYQT